MKSLFKNLKAIDQSQDKSCVELARRLTSFLLSGTIFTGTSFSLAFSITILGYTLPAAAGGTTYCQSPYGEVYGTVTPKSLHVIHGSTGASALLTTSTFSVAAINGMATDHVNKLVYYGDANSLYAWNALTNQHILITNNFSSFIPSSYKSLYSFTTLSSGGAAFYNGSLYFGVDGNATNSFEIFKVDFATASNGTTIQTVTPLNVVGNSGGGLFRTNEDWGDFIISDTGIILALSSQSGAAHLWNYNLNTNQYTNISAPTGGNHQFGKSGDGKLWALFSSGNVREILPNGTYIGTTKTTVSVSDGGECVVGNATVGDRVWADANGNGIQDVGELGITGVSVSVYRDINKDGVLAATDPLLATQTTDANGNYNFTELLPHDPVTGSGHNDFIIQITGGVPTGYTATTATRQTVDLSSATQTVTTVDFGYKPPTYSVSGTLYKDNNSNNTNDSEPALGANVTVTLYQDNNGDNIIDAGEQVASPVVTNASGQYSFSNILAGTYKIKVDTADTDIPSGYILGTANDLTATVSNANVTGKDFGFDQPTYDISGTLYEDRDRDNNFDSGEPTLLANITVKLLNSAGTTTIATTTTNATGQYTFIGFPNGNYKIQVDNTDTDIPSGYILGTANDLAVTVAGSPVSNQNFGFDIPSNPNVLLIKRITAVNNLTTTKNGDNLGVYKDQDTNPYDDNNITITNPNPPSEPADTDKWLDPNTFLIGGINGGNVRPNDEIEYTIYYLSAGDATASKVLMCDRVPENVTFMPTAFNSFPTKNSSGLPGSDRGIVWQYNGATQSLTNTSDGDTAEYLAPGVDPVSKYPGIKCDGSNTNGVVVVNLGNLPNATAPGTPINSYGFIRFRGKVK